MHISFNLSTWWEWLPQRWQFVHHYGLRLGWYRYREWKRAIANAKENPDVWDNKYAFRVQETRKWWGDYDCGKLDPKWRPNFSDGLSGQVFVCEPRPWLKRPTN